MKIKKAHIPLYLAPFLGDTIAGCITIAVPLLAIRLEASSFTLGMLGFTPGIAYVSLCFLFGKLSEDYHKRHFILLGSSLFIAVCIILCFSSQISQLYVSMLLRGIGAAMIWPALESLIAEKESGQSLARRMGLFNISWSTGITAGPLIGGVLFGIGAKLPFCFALILGLLLFFTLIWHSRMTNSSPPRQSRKDFVNDPLFSETLSQGLPFFIRTSRVANFALYFSMGTVRYMFPELGTELGVSAPLLGVLMFVLSFSRILTFFSLGKTHLWHYRLFPLVLFQIVALCGFLIIFASSSSLFFLGAFICIGLGAGMSYSASIFYSMSTSSQRGRSAAIHETVLGTGFILGCLTGGAVAEGISLRAPYLLSSVVIGGAVLIQVLSRRKNF